jgi:hypothetical protein
MGSRLTVAIWAVALALPCGPVACVYVLAHNIGDDSVRHSQVPYIAGLVAIWVLSALAAFVIGSHTSGRKIDGEKFAMGYVAIGSTGGIIIGLALSPFIPFGGESLGSVMAPALGLSLLGGFLATFAKPRAGRSQRGPDSKPLS